MVSALEISESHPFLQAKARKVCTPGENTVLRLLKVTLTLFSGPAMVSPVSFSQKYCEPGVTFVRVSVRVVPGCSMQILLEPAE